MQDIEWNYFYRCFDCNKDLDKIGGSAHQTLGHKVDCYKTMPKLVERVMPEVKSPIKQEIKDDYAESYEEEIGEGK